MQENETCENTASVFDFDGTITKKNTAIAFLKFISGDDSKKRFLSRVPDVIKYYLKMIDLDQLNANLINTFFKNLSRQDLFQYGRDFYTLVLPNLIKASAFARIAWHQKQGHQCWLATSAYNVYVDYWALQNGFNGVVSTQIEFNKEDRATGRLLGKSCNGQEKLRRVMEVIGEPKIIYAYGDSEGDRELLNYATYSFYRKFK